MKRLPEHLLNVFVAFIIALSFTAVFHKYGLKDGTTIAFFGIFLVSLAILYCWMKKSPCCD